MNKTMRSVTMAGLGLLAGASVAAAPAMAGSTTTAVAKPENAAVQQYIPYGTAVVGYYGSRVGCQRAAVLGGSRGFWASSAYSCNTVSVVPAGVIGVRPGAYALAVDPDDCNWGAAGFQSFYTTQAFRFSGDSFLAYGPQWRAWVASPVGISPFGYRTGFNSWWRYGNRGHGWGNRWGHPRHWGHGGHGGGHGGGRGGWYGGGFGGGHGGGGGFGGGHGGGHGGGRGGGFGGGHGGGFGGGHGGGNGGGRGGAIGGAVAGGNGGGAIAGAIAGGNGGGRGGAIAGVIGGGR
jgi:hypothetical protein